MHLPRSPFRDRNRALAALAVCAVAMLVLVLLRGGWGSGNGSPADGGTDRQSNVGQEGSGSGGSGDNGSETVVLGPDGKPVPAYDKPGVTVADGIVMSDEPVEVSNPDAPGELLASGDIPSVTQGTIVEPSEVPADQQISLDGTEKYPGNPGPTPPVDYTVGDKELTAALASAAKPLWSAESPPAQRAAGSVGTSTLFGWQSLNGSVVELGGVLEGQTSALLGVDTCSFYGVADGCATGTFTVEIDDNPYPVRWVFTKQADGVWKPSGDSVCATLAALGHPC